MNSIVVGVIKTYQALLSPLLPANTCRFHPTCSSYSLEAFRKYSFIRAAWLTAQRVARCHPWHPGGFDPVP